MNKEQIQEKLTAYFGIVKEKTKKEVGFDDRKSAYDIAHSHFRGTGFGEHFEASLSYLYHQYHFIGVQEQMLEDRPVWIKENEEQIQQLSSKKFKWYQFLAKRENEREIERIRSWSNELFEDQNNAPSFIAKLRDKHNEVMEKTLQQYKEEIIKFLEENNK